MRWPIHSAGAATARRPAGPARAIGRGVDRMPSARTRARASSERGVRARPHRGGEAARGSRLPRRGAPACQHGQHDQQRQPRSPARACSAPRHRRSPIARLLTPCGIGERLVHAGASCGVGVAHHLVDREEAGVLREQVVLQAQLGDALALGVAAFERLLVRQAGDAVACPQVAQRRRVLADRAAAPAGRCGTGRWRSGLR